MLWGMVMGTWGMEIGSVMGNGKEDMGEGYGDIRKVMGI